MKKIMVCALGLMMALSIVSCSEDGDDKPMISLAIVNSMNYDDPSEAVFVDSAVGGGMDIIAELMPGGVTLDPQRVFVFGSFTSQTVIDVTSTVDLPAGAFSATYQVRSDLNGDCPGGSCSFETNMTGMITSNYTLEKNKTYLVYYCNLAEDNDSGTDMYNDGYTDYVKVFEYVNSWNIDEMILLTVNASGVSCDETSVGSCVGIGAQP
jgi:hypothetical protein